MRKPLPKGKTMDNLIFCLNATVPIFAIILLGRLLRELDGKDLINNK